MVNAAFAQGHLEVLILQMVKEALVLVAKLKKAEIQALDA